MSKHGRNRRKTTATQDIIGGDALAEPISDVPEAVPDLSQATTGAPLSTGAAGITPTVEPTTTVVEDIVTAPPPEQEVALVEVTPPPVGVGAAGTTGGGAPATDPLPDTTPDTSVGGGFVTGYDPIDQLVVDNPGALFGLEDFGGAFDDIIYLDSIAGAGVLGFTLSSEVPFDIPGFARFSIFNLVPDLPRDLLPAGTTILDLQSILQDKKRILGREWGGMDEEARRKALREYFQLRQAFAMAVEASANITERIPSLPGAPAEVQRRWYKANQDFQRSQGKTDQASIDLSLAAQKIIQDLIAQYGEPENATNEGGGYVSRDPIDQPGDDPEDIFNKGPGGDTGTGDTATGDATDPGTIDQQRGRFGPGISTGRDEVTEETTREAQEFRDEEQRVKDEEEQRKKDEEEEEQREKDLLDFTDINDFIADSLANAGQLSEEEEATIRQAGAEALDQSLSALSGRGLGRSSEAILAEVRGRQEITRSVGEAQREARREGIANMLKSVELMLESKGLELSAFFQKQAQELDRLNAAWDVALTIRDQDIQQMLGLSKLDLQSAIFTGQLSFDKSKQLYANWLSLIGVDQTQQQIDANLLQIKNQGASAWASFISAMATAAALLIKKG